MTSKFDAIIVHETSPITQGFPALVVKKLQRIPIYFWVLDLWPESLQSAGGITNKYVLGFFTEITKLMYNQSRKILISSKGFRKSILDKGTYDNKLVYFPNWAEDIFTQQVSANIPTNLHWYFLQVFMATDMKERREANLLLMMLRL